MAHVVHDDLVEQILIRLDVKDLICFKSVCKSWYSLITSSGFVNRHLNYSYNRDRHDSKLGVRRIDLVHSEHYRGYLNLPYCLAGSSNGLVCISSSRKSEVLVGNPLTGDVRQLRPPPCIKSSDYWGFGYDSSTDDYKVVVGNSNMHRTCFRVFSLKSNVWRVIGEVKYTYFNNSVGILCNGALHWYAKDGENMKHLIISFSLSKNEFTEIPPPNNADYEPSFYSCIGTINECLCIYQRPPLRIWVMKKYNVAQSWERLPQSLELQPYIVHYLKTSADNITSESYFRSNGSWSLKYNINHSFTTPVFVRSLVSPHVDGRLKRRMTRAKSIKGRKACV